MRCTGTYSAAAYNDPKPFLVLLGAFKTAPLVPTAVLPYYHTTVTPRSMHLPSMPSDFCSRMLCP